MKKLFLFPAIFVFVGHCAEAKIWRVNNNPGITANFTTAQAAHDAAAVLGGDTLYFEHSSANYGDLIMAKRLVLVGTGDFLLVNPGSQYNLNGTSLLNLKIRPSAANSIISISVNSIKDSADGVLITRCRVNAGIEFYWSANCTVSNCFLGAGVNFYAKLQPVTYSYIACNNITLNNNIIESGIQVDSYYYNYTPCSGCTASWVTLHSINVFNNSVTGSIGVTGIVFNNILAGINTDVSTPVTNNVFYNALSVNYMSRLVIVGSPVTIPFEGGNNNQFSVASNTLYVGGGPDTSYKLKPACFAIGAGTSGVDCGATGGGAPYVFGVQPAIPAIYKLSAAAASFGSTIGVTVSTKSNN